MSERFRELGWKVASVDIREDSNATIIKDILNLEFNTLPFIPDFIWASPPCTTFSRMNGGVDRGDDSNPDKTDRARRHNNYLLKMFEIMQIAKYHHHHLTVIIENPVGKLKNTALMVCLVRSSVLSCFAVISQYNSFRNTHVSQHLLFP